MGTMAETKALLPPRTATCKFPTPHLKSCLLWHTRRASEPHCSAHNSADRWAMWKPGSEHLSTEQLAFPQESVTAGRAVRQRGMGHQQFILPRKLHLPQGKMGPDQGGGGGERKQDMLQEMLSSATVFSNVSQLHKRYDKDKSGETSHWVPVLSSQTCCQDKRWCMSRLCHRGISSPPLLLRPGDAAPGDRHLCPMVE